MRMRLLLSGFLLFSLVIQIAIAEELGRLFMNEEERSKLNILRSQPSTPKQQLINSLPDPPRYITFKGVVIRQDGSTIIWISDENHTYPPNTLYQPGFSVTLDHSLRDHLLVTLPKANKKKWLKLGETLDTTTYQVVGQPLKIN